jgi:putative transposase
MYIDCVIERKANTYRLYPTPDQAQQMAQIAGSCRFVYNLALEQRSEWWRPGRTFNFASQCREVTMLRAEVDWLKAAPVHTLQQALKDLDRAYQNWWAGRAEYPTPRKKGLNDSFRFPDPISIKVVRTGNSSGRIKLPKLGWVRLRGWYAIPGDICNATISRRAGQWHVAVQWQRDVAEPLPSFLPAVGIDRGVAVFAAMSNGVNIAPENYGKKALGALRKAQRSLSRKKRGSSNRRKAIRRVAKIQMRVANARKNFLHEQTTAIAQNHGTVVLEALKVRNMSASAKGTAAEPGKMVRQKAGLNRAILDQGWGGFRIMLGYKLADRGGRLIEVSAAYTSQTCAACGVVDARSRQDQARFVCTGCGYEANADTNAAINIIKRGLDKSLKPVEGYRSKRPDDAGSIRRAA